MSTTLRMPYGSQQRELYRAIRLLDDGQDFASMKLEERISAALSILEHVYVQSVTIELRLESANKMNQRLIKQVKEAQEVKP